LLKKRKTIGYRYQQRELLLDATESSKVRTIHIIVVLYVPGRNLHALCLRGSGLHGFAGLRLFRCSIGVLDVVTNLNNPVVSIVSRLSLHEQVVLTIETYNEDLLFVVFLVLLDHFCVCEV